MVNLENELAKALEELVEEKENVLHLEDNEKAIQQSYKACNCALFGIKFLFTPCNLAIES